MARPGASGASPGSRGGASSKKTEKGTKARIQKTEGKKGRPKYVLDKETLAQVFHLPFEKACEQLGIGSTTLKRICREQEIGRWPYRRLMCADQITRRKMEASLAKKTKQPLEKLRKDAPQQSSGRENAKDHPLPGELVETAEEENKGNVVREGEKAAHSEMAVKPKKGRPKGRANGAQAGTTTGAGAGPGPRSRKSANTSAEYLSFAQAVQQEINSDSFREKLSQVSKAIEGARKKSKQGKRNSNGATSSSAKKGFSGMLSSLNSKRKKPVRKSKSFYMYVKDSVWNAEALFVPDLETEVQPERWHEELQKLSGGLEGLQRANANSRKGVQRSSSFLLQFRDDSSIAVSPMMTYDLPVDVFDNIEDILKIFDPAALENTPINESNHFPMMNVVAQNVKQAHLANKANEAQQQGSGIAQYNQNNGNGNQRQASQQPSRRRIASAAAGAGARAGAREGSYANQQNQNQNNPNAQTSNQQRQDFAHMDELLKFFD